MVSACVGHMVCVTHDQSVSGALEALGARGPGHPALRVSPGNAVLSTTPERRITLVSRVSQYYCRCTGNITACSLLPLPALMSLLSAGGALSRTHREEARSPTLAAADWVGAGVGPGPPGTGLGCFLSRTLHGALFPKKEEQNTAHTGA